MGARKRRAADRAGRPAMRSPGRPPVGRRKRRQWFWAAIARGSSSEAAGVAAGVSPAVGSRWFREGGGMPTLSRAPLSGRSLSFAERDELAILGAQDVGGREIARRLGRSPATVSRELGRNAATVAGAWSIGPRPRPPSGTPTGVLSAPRSPSWLPTSGSGARCSNGWPGEITQPNDIAVSGPAVGGIGRRHGRRTDRRWAQSWSPEQIANRLGSTSPMMGPCRSPMRPSTRRWTSRAAAPCAVS